MPNPEGSPGRLELSAFQINDMALFTIKARAHLITSGMAHVSWPNPKQIQIDGGLPALRAARHESAASIGGGLIFEVDSIVDDPATVGKFKNQTRLLISGHLDVSSEDLDALLAQWLVLGARERPEDR
jgi:hypothetical protein